MGKIKVRYYTIRRRNGRTLGYWQPSKAMRQAGFALASCGEDGPAAWRVAGGWEARWDEYRAGGVARRWPVGSVGAALTISAKLEFGLRKSRAHKRIGNAAGNISDIPSGKSRQKLSSSPRPTPGIVRS